MERWAEKNGVTITKKEDMDIDSFKEAVDGVDQWFVEELKNKGYDDGQELVDAFKQISKEKHLLRWESISEGVFL